MFELKPMSREAIPMALDKALRYRLLNEPAEAESICHDVLNIEPENQQALITLLLALTDRFGKGYGVGEIQPESIVPRLTTDYDRVYYAGIVSERRGKKLLQHGGSPSEAFAFLQEAMGHFEKAEAIRPAGNDDSLLHWNACARIITANRLTPRAEESVHLQSE